MFKSVVGTVWVVVEQYSNKKFRFTINIATMSLVKPYSYWKVGYFDLFKIVSKSIKCLQKMCSCV